MLIAMLGASMAALLACGASTEPESNQSSGSAASAPTAVPTDEPTADQAAAVATPTDTPVPAVVSEPTLTMTTTDASPQAVPTETPTLVPTHTAMPVTATPVPAVAILSPGVAVGKEVWWARPGRYGDQTPPGALENHPYGRQLHSLGGSDVETMILDQVIAVLRQENPMPADQEAEAIARMKEPRFGRAWGWEIADADEPLVMYWGYISWGGVEPYAGAVVRYGSSGKPDGFAEAPDPAIGITEGLETNWWERDVIPKKRERSRAIYWAEDPDQHGPALDLIDGELDHYDYPAMPNKLKQMVAEKYGTSTAGAIYLAFREQTESSERSAFHGGDSIIEKLAENANWEVISTKDLTVRYWGVISHNILTKDYKVGAVLKFTTTEKPPIGGYQAKLDDYPIRKFLGQRPTVLEFFITPIDK